MTFFNVAPDQYWNAATNTPKLVSGQGISGKGYIVATGGGSTLIDGNSAWNAGDIIVFLLDKWIRFAGATSTQIITFPYAGAFTVVNLPAAPSVPQSAWASNGRKIAESAGNGTGVFVYYTTGLGWLVFSSDQPVQA
jgi:hypothetical protein